MTVFWFGGEMNDTWGVSDETLLPGFTCRACDVYGVSQQDEQPIEHVESDKSMKRAKAKQKKRTPLNKSLNEVAKEVHALAWEKGWHSDEEKEDAFIERACNNLHDEVSELHEAWRNNRLHQLCDKANEMKELGIDPLTCVEEEIADIIIRVLDDSEKLKVDVQSAVERKHQFNKSRANRHGGKKS